MEVELGMETAPLTAAIFFLDNRGIMLKPVVFAPAAQWAADSLRWAGVTRFLVVCRREDQDAAAACFPGNTGYIFPDDKDAGEKLRTFLEHTQGRVAVFTKPVLFFRSEAEIMADGEGLEIGANDAGAYRMEAKELLARMEEAGGLQEALAQWGGGLNENVTVIREDWLSREYVQELARKYMARWWMQRGVFMVDPDRVYIAPTVVIEPGVTLLPGTILRGNTRIGGGSEIGPDALLEDTQVGENSRVNASQCYQCSIGSRTAVGPYSCIRPNTRIGDDAVVGVFVEVKNSTVGDGTAMAHLTYVGDSDVGAGVNFGCGTVTVNYDGVKKFRTTVGDGAFIGCNTNLVAPVSVGEGAYIAAGSTITEDVPPESLAIARAQQTVKNQWAKKKRGK